MLKKGHKVLFFGLFISCKSIKPAIYFSNCLLYGKSKVILKLNIDKSFIYNFRYSEKEIMGKWKVSSDTLILTSDFFLKETFDSLGQAVKNSDIYGEDKYLIKGNKFLIIDQNGLQNNCYLKRR